MASAQRKLKQTAENSRGRDAQNNQTCIVVFANFSGIVEAELARGSQQPCLQWDAKIKITPASAALVMQNLTERVTEHINTLPYECRVNVLKGGVCITAVSGSNKFPDATPLTPSTGQPSRTRHAARQRQLLVLPRRLHAAA
eukprot:1936820-Rhodomonas_salina.1